MKLRVEKAFTLIELLVVIGIIGILVALTAFNFQQARERARDVQRKSELKQIQNALEMYKNDQMPQRYPNALTALTTTYLNTVPEDPMHKAGLTWPDYSYVLGGTNLQYVLTTCLENRGDPDAAGGVSPCSASANGIIYTVTQP